MELNIEPLSPSEHKDFPMMWKVYDHIVAHPDEWDQRSWAQRKETAACGTAFCFAGHAVYMARPDAELQWRESWEDGRWFAETVIVDGEERHIRNVAGDILGLATYEAEELFDASNSIDDLHGCIMAWETSEFTDV